MQNVTILAGWILLTGAALGYESQERPAPSSPAAPAQDASLLLGPGDQIAVWAVGMPEISEKPVRVDENGSIDLPMLGKMQVAGHTLEECRKQLLEALAKYVRTPVVSVSLTESKSQPVTVLGSVGNPGLHQLNGRKTLLEVLALAGGLRPEAGDVITITRRDMWGRLPLSATKEGPGFSVSEIKTRELLRGNNVAGNLVIMPHDVISVPAAEMVYVVGEVQRAGGFPLKDKESVSVLQALSLAGGLGPTAAQDKAKILRQWDGETARAEIPVNLKKVLAGRTSDVPLQAGDILFVPNSASKAATKRALEAALQTAVGVAIWRH